MRTISVTRIALLSAVLLLAGCTNNATQAPPLAAAPVSPAPAASPSPERSPSPSPSPSSAPLSAFEADPAVVGLRTYLRAVAAAVNAKNLQLPALVDAATARRNSRHQSLYGENIGLYYPGPNPLAVLGVRVVSPTVHTVLGCSLEAGLVLDRPGGKPVSARKVLGGGYEMLLEGTTWKVNTVMADTAVDCTGVSLQGEVA